MDSKWKLIGRGLNGWHAKSDTSTISQGYAETDGDKFAKDSVDGALVYDAKHADEDTFSHFIISGPMVSTSLPIDGVDSLTKKDRVAALRMAPMLGGAFRSYALACQSQEFGGLDTVGVGVYEGLLRRIKGVRFGHVKNGLITWEDSKE